MITQICASRNSWSCGRSSVSAASAAPAANRYASARALIRRSNSSGSSFTGSPRGLGLEPPAPCRQARKSLVTLDDAALDRVLVVAVVDQVPCLVRDVARRLRRGLFPEHVDELQLEALELPGRVSRRHARQRIGGRLPPHLSRHHQAVAKLHLVHGLTRLP